MSLTPVSEKNVLPARLPIPKLTQLSAPYKMVFIGIHTKKEQVSGTQYKRVLVSGHAIYWKREKKKSKERIEVFDFDLNIDFFEWLSSKVNKRETLYVYSYDAVTDFLALDGFRQMPLQEFTLESIYHKLTTTILKFKNENRRITILDVQNYYPVKLDKLARSFKIDLLPELDEEAKRFEVDQWCITKAELLHTILRALIKETIEAGRGSLKMTSSSTSHSIFRASYMKHKIVTNHDPEVVSFERSSYVGGYTGINRLVQGGEPELYKVDVNSMYPSVMADKMYPTQLIEYAKDLRIGHLERYLNGYLVIANVNLYAHNSIYPMKHDEQSFYPLGGFNATLTTASLIKALNNDEIRKVNQIAVYMGQPIFSEFVRDVYNRRMAARADENTALELFQKAISNTLYGKFGQLQTETVRVGNAPIDEFCVMDAFSPDDKTAWLEMHAGGSVLFIHKAGESRYTSFAIASHVTDYARQKLFDLEYQAGKENVFYMDTDSLIVNAEGLRNLYPHINPSAMGLLKLEETAPFFIGFAKKDYIFGDNRKMKGFDPNGKRIDGNVFTQFQRASFQGAMQKRFSGGAFWNEVNKLYKPFIQGQHIDKEGNVKPVNMPAEAEQISTRHYTISVVRDLAKYMLNNAQRSMMGEWLGLSS